MIPGETGPGRSWRRRKRRGWLSSDDRLVRFDVGDWRFFNVMAARVAAIHDFTDGDKDVDGRPAGYQSHTSAERD